MLALLLVFWIEKIGFFQDGADEGATKISEDEQDDHQRKTGTFEELAKVVLFVFLATLLDFEHVAGDDRLLSAFMVRRLRHRFFW